MDLNNRTRLPVEALQGLLLYGTKESRRRLAQEIAASGDGRADDLEVLMETARPGASALLRARCLELLEMVQQVLAARPAAEP